MCFKRILYKNSYKIFLFVQKVLHNSSNNVYKNKTSIKTIISMK